MIEGKKKLGDMLVEAGIIDDMQRNAVLREQRQWGGKFASTLIRMGFIDDKPVALTLEKQLGQECMSLKNKDIPLNVLSMVKPDIAKKYNVMPLDFDKRTLYIAISNPQDLGALDELSFTIGVNIKPVLALEYEITKAIAQYYH